MYIAATIEEMFIKYET